LPKPSKIKRISSPPKEEALHYAKKEFLFLEEISTLMRTPKDIVEAYMYQGGLHSYPFLCPDGSTVRGYLTYQVKKVLAAKGRVVPYFNEEFATQRQWEELIAKSLEKPLQEDWYFPPVNPDPLIRISEASASSILKKIQEAQDLQDSPEEKLRLIADIINVNAKDLQK